MVARMTSLLEIQSTDRVLEVGTGSGYQTAVLAELGSKVFSIERHLKLLLQARATIEQQGYRNVVLRHGDGTIGWAEFAPYDRIVVTAAAPTFPRTLFTQLKDGGLMILPMGEKVSQTLLLIQRQGSEAVVNEVGQVSFVPLIGREGWQPSN
jgi:protein-L-isoaspartate(D-aspartate) O-methyltransferase